MFIPSGTAQINLKYTGGGLPQGGQIAFGVSVGALTDPADVGNQVKLALADGDWMDGVSSAVQVSSMLIKMGPNDIGPMAEIAVGQVGLDAGQPLPPNVTILARKGTALGGRANQGRMYIPGCPESQSDGSGQLSGPAVAGFQTKMNDLLAALEDHSVPMLLLHSVDRPGEIPLAVTSLTVQSTLATQRRRLR